MGLRSVALLCLVLVASLGARRVHGPISGVVETTDGVALEDVVVKLRCSGHFVHGAVPTDRETRIVATGRRFRFLFAWSGLSPVGCSVQVHHPLYVSGHAPVGDAFAPDLGTIRLVPWDAFLDAGTPDEEGDASHPWPSIALHQHLSHTRLYFVPAHAERRRGALAFYVPALHAIFERGVRRLPTSWHDDSPWARSLRETLRGIEEAVDYERPPPEVELRRAAAAGELPGVRALLAAGVDPDALGADGAAAIHLASSSGDAATVAALLDGGASIDRQREGAGNTALLDALARGHDAVALLLIERGADVTLASWRGSPLQVVGARGSVVEALIARGAVEGADPARVARTLQGSVGRNPVVLRALLGAGVPPDARVQAEGPTALMFAARRGDVASARLLIDAGADVNARAEDGATPLTRAREGGHPDLAAMLRERGARE